MNEKTEKEKKKSILRTLLINAIFLIVCAVVAYFLANYLFTTITVDGHSMEQTLHDEDKVLLYKPGEYRFGDVVVFDSGQKTGNGESRYFVKRIIGLPGDTVEILPDETDGKFYVWRNGVKLIEPYCSSEMYAEMERVVIPEGQFFYLGDNRAGSSDSRVYGCGSLEGIIGRVVVRYRGTLKNLDISFVRRLLMGYK